MSVQIIKKEGRPEWAVVPYEEYQCLVEQAEMLRDIRDFDEVRLAIGSREEELIPGEIAYALLEGANPIRVWREFRGMTQQEVADQAGISKPYLSQLETAQRKGATEVLRAVAKVLNVTLEDLLTPEPEE